MSIKKTKFKIELILLLCFGILFMKALPVAEVKETGGRQTQNSSTGKDEQTGLLVVEYATGNETLLKKEAVGIRIASPSGADVCSCTGRIYSGK